MPPLMPQASDRRCSIQPFPVRHVADIEPQAAEHRWLIESLWLSSGVGILGGAPKVCKTFFAAELSLAVAGGVAALDRYPARIQGPVLFYGAEDSLAALRTRFDGLARVRGLDLAQLPVFLLDIPSLRLDRREDLLRLRAAIESQKPRLLVLDPFIRIAKVDENSAAEVSAVLGSLRAIQRDHDLAVLLVHHARKTPASNPGQALRGSSDFAAWSDSNLYLARNGQRLMLHLEHRSAAAPEPIALRLASDPAPHLVLAEPGDASAGYPADAGDPLQHEILHLLSNSSTPLPTVSIRKQLCKRNEDVVRALSDLHAHDRIRRGSLGWSVPEADHD